MAEFKKGPTKIQPATETIGHLFLSGSGRYYNIPHYQRDYSWNSNEKQPQQFFNDVVSRLQLDKKDTGELVSTPSSYFIGTMLFKGDWSADSGCLEVVDGQQRLTTIFLFLGALSNRLVQTANTISGYGFNDDEKWAILAERFQDLGDRISKDRLQRETSPELHTTCPLLQVEVGENTIDTLVFDKEQEKEKLRPSCQAESNIKQAYRYIYKHLAPDSMAKIDPFKPFSDELNEINKGETDNASKDLSYSNYYIMLAGIFRQLCAPTVIVLSMQSDKQINEVFESLNSKGKNLEPVDLIKNSIFERLPPEPLDHAHKYWKSLKGKLSKTKEKDAQTDPWINLGQFFSIFWPAVEGSNATRDKLYQDFQNQFSDASQDDLIDFLKSADDFAKDVAAMYGIRQPESIPDVYLKHITEGLRYLVQVQAAKQSFPVIASALHACRYKVLPASKLVELLDFLAVAFLFLRDVRGSKYTKYLRRAANSLIKTTDDHSLQEEQKSKMAVWYIRYLEEQLSNVIGDVSEKDIRELLNHKSEFEYSNSSDDRKAHIRVQYLLRIRCYQMLRARSDCRVESEANFVWNVEHILPDEKREDSYTHQLGNLVWLERDINSKCGNSGIPQKVKLYTKSNNPELTDLSGFLKRLQGSDEEKQSAVEERSFNILNDLYEQTIKNPEQLKSEEKDGKDKREAKARRIPPDPSYLKRYNELLKVTGKKKLPDIWNEGWFHTFASQIALNNKAGEQQFYPNDAAFITPLILFDGKTGIQQIDTLLTFIDEATKQHFMFKRRNSKGDFKNKFPSTYRSLLMMYRDFLTSL